MLALYMLEGLSAMDGESYSFKLGGFRCVCLSDGSFDYSPKAFFKNAPAEEVQELLRARNLPADHITTPYTYLYANTGSHHVLVDAGAGGLGPSTGRLLDSMEMAGIDRAAIDTVLITHAHPDHIGGILDQSGEPVLSKARYYMWKREWDYWHSEEAVNNANMLIAKFAKMARDTLHPIRMKTTCFEFEDGEREIIPGVVAVKAPGHTPGHVVVCLTSEGEKLVYISDTVLYPIHLERPDWLPVFDILPDEAADTKKRIFDWVAEESSLVVGQHFPPFPGLGHVVKKGQAWEWQPLDLEQ